MKQRNLSFIKIINSLAILSLVFVFASCESKEDMPSPTVEEEVTFQVDLLKMAALEIKEAEGQTLEIYGTVSTKLIIDNVTESNTLWTRGEDAAIGVGLSDVPVVASVSYKVASSDIADSNIEVRADLSDYDGGGDNNPEDLGNEAITIGLGNITSSVTYEIVLNDSAGQEVQVTYSITRL